MSLSTADGKLSTKPFAKVVGKADLPQAARHYWYTSSSICRASSVASSASRSGRSPVSLDEKNLVCKRKLSTIPTSNTFRRDGNCNTKIVSLYSEEVSRNYYFKALGSCPIPRSHALSNSKAPNLFGFFVQPFSENILKTSSRHPACSL